MTFIKIASSASVAAAFALGSVAASAQSPAAKQLVGEWTLVTESNTKDGVTKKGAGFGDNPKGLLILTASGRYTSINMRGDLPKFASGSRLQGTDAENKAIVQGSIAHFGTYTVSADGKMLTLQPQASTWPAWTGQPQERQITLKGDELRWTVKASFGGVSELVYKRASVK